MMTFLRKLLARWGTLCAMTLAIWQLCLFPAAATALYEIPTVAPGVPTWSIDRAEVLSLSTRTKISTALGKLAQDTGKEVRFVTLHRFDYGDNAETFAHKIFQKWFPEAADQANQMLIVLDDLTNTTAVVTGSGMQQVITPEIANSIAQETMIVPLRQGNRYNQAFSDAVDRIVAVVSGQPDPGPPVVQEAAVAESNYLTAAETEANRTSFVTIVVVLLIAATVIPMATWWWYQNQD
jgi:uncharacterized protein